MPRETFSLQTPDSLRALAKELERIAMQYRVAADSWDGAAIGELPVKGEQERARALKGASQFAQNALLSMWDELMRRQKLGLPISAAQLEKWKAAQDVSDSVSDSPPNDTKK